MLHENDYVGSFADGLSKRHVRRGTLRGDFAAGHEDRPRLGTIQPVGDFATGHEAHESDPTALRGDYARGRREKPRA